MNRTKRLAGKIGFVLCGALLGYTTYGQPSVSVEVGVPGVEIRAESDFYEPLTPYGRWEVVGSYGRCWIPGHVETDWRPYSDGYWQLTDAGWYWVSNEPWAWATYHYGRWDLSAQFGWYWVPQTQWAPAWVSWHSGGGYVGWAPLYPSGVRVISPRAYVFVEERHFMEPVRRSTVIVANTTIINKTVINEAPATAVIEKASGRKVQALPVREVRQKAEAAVVVKQRTPTATSEKPAVATHESVAPAPKNNEAVSGETRKPEAKPEARPEARPVAIKEPTAQKANKQPVKQEKPAKPSAKKAQRPAGEKSPASEKNGANPADKEQDNKPKN